MFSNVGNSSAVVCVEQSVPFGLVCCYLCPPDTFPYQGKRKLPTGSLFTG